MAEETKKKRSIPGVVTFLLALAAFIMSAAALVMSYDNGRLVKDAQNVLEEVREGMKKRETSSSREKGGESERKSDFRRLGAELKSKLEEARTRLLESQDHASAKKKLEEIRSELERYQEKWKPTSRVVFNDLRKEVNETIEALREKTRDAGERLENLSKRLPSFLREEEKETSKEE